MTSQHRPPLVEVSPGDPAACPAWCVDRAPCLVCGVRVCPLHSEAFALSECVDGGFHHQDECESLCVACDTAAAEDYWADRADAIRKEGSW